jgi:hypothetical protein
MLAESFRPRTLSEVGSGLKLLKLHSTFSLKSLPLALRKREYVADQISGYKEQIDRCLQSFQVRVSSVSPFRYLTFRDCIRQLASLTHLGIELTAQRVEIQNVKGAIDAGFAGVTQEMKTLSSGDQGDVVRHA